MRALERVLRAIPWQVIASWLALGLGIFGGLCADLIGSLVAARADHLCEGASFPGSCRWLNHRMSWVLAGLEIVLLLRWGIHGRARRRRAA